MQPEVGAVGGGRVAPLEAASEGRDADPVSVVKAMADAVNAGDVERCLACFSRDAVITLRPEYPALADRTHADHAYTRKWVEKSVHQHFKMEYEVEHVDGNRVRARTRTWMAVTERLGLAPVFGTEEYVVRDGRITGYTWTSSEETRRKFLALRRKVVGAVATAVALVAAALWWLLR